MKHLFAIAAMGLLAGCSDDGTRNSITYSSKGGYTPLRTYESSVLNEPDTRGNNDWAGRGYRVNGSGYGPLREKPHATTEPGGKALGVAPIEKTTDNY